jgi:site-specific DNA recombinase
MSERGWTSKTWVTQRGKLHQGMPLNKQRLSSLLKNIMYIGKIRYKDEIHEGEHDAIIDKDTWNEVQAQLKKGCRLPDQPRNRYNSLLRGLLHCTSCDAPMIHLPVSKNGKKVYRYYVCTNAHTNGYDKCPTPSIPAAEIERFVLERLVELGSNEEVLDAVIEQVNVLWAEKTETLYREERRLQLQIDTLRQGSEKSDQREQRAAQANLHRLRKQIKEASKEGVTVAECEDALGRFESLMDRLTIDEKSWLLNLLFERIDFDGQTGRIKFHIHDDSLLSTAVA